MFTPFDPKQTIPQTEEQILKLWKDRQIFQASMEQRKGNEPFVFYEGPPTANGRPGIHHVMARTFKDAVCRYQTMKGRYVLRKAGWDTHGLPVELQVEKALGLKNKQDIEAYGVAEFNQQCRESVWQYKEEWEKITERMGYWVDLDHPYVTYETDYIQSVWWGLKQVWDKGLIQQDYKVVPYCPRCGTALSLAEVAQGYKDVTETSVYVTFKLLDEAAAILAWTTTPWTLPGNVALAVGKNIPYTKVKQSDNIYYLAKERLGVLEGDYEILEELTGRDLVGKRYQPLFDTIDLNKETGKTTGYQVLAADFVTTEDGTGVVHTAVMYGEEDFNLGKQADLPALHTVDEKGQFTELVAQWSGQFVKDAEASIIDYLKEHNLLYKTEQTTHTYPFCWRCGTPLLYYARSSWFIRVDQQLRDRLVELNQQIKWVPEHLKDGRFGNWLSGLRDWAISRERYWGTPLPIWICQNDKNHKVMVSSLDEARQLATADSKAKLTSDFDPHKPFIDGIEFDCPECQGTMQRVPEVLDVWFDSGAMPWAQWGYPQQGTEQFKAQFPADYIAEGIDQTRGWFNSLLILSTLIFDQPAYRSVISPNLVLDEHGQKMSKSKGNVVDPWLVMGDTGIDALRLYFMSVNQPGEYKNFSIKAVQEVYRKTVMIWWNVVNFFLTYAALDQWQPGQVGEPTVMDRWIMARAAQATKKIDQGFADLDTFTASRELRAFIDELSTWYLRRSRKRRDAAFYATLHTVLIQASQIAAPMLPFIAEATYQALKTDTMPESVHLTDFPGRDMEFNEDLLNDMAVVRELVTLGHAARAQGGVKLRQPLARAIILSTSLKLDSELLDIVVDELNVKSVEVATQDPRSTETEGKWLTAEAGNYTVIVDAVLTPELREEGMYRDLVRELQELRKKSGCRPGQLVHFIYQTDNGQAADFMMRHREGLATEVGALSLTAEVVDAELSQTTFELDGHTLIVGLRHE